VPPRKRLLRAAPDASQTKKFLIATQRDDAARDEIGDAACLTSPFSRGISHAHAGLAKLRPPFPKPPKL
jgi:hypothetical protein